MKKLDFFFLMVLICAIGMVGCSQQDSVSEPAEKAAELEISISKADALKAGALDDEWYCPDGFADEGTAKVTYTVTVKGETAAKDFTVPYDYETNNEGVIQAKIQLNWKDFGAKETDVLIVEVTNVAVGGYNFITPSFAAPKDEALYKSYIDPLYQINRPIEVELYEKEYIDVKVLCFNKQDIPEFGFSWFDFEIITGEEVCVYFNCLDEEGLHRNVNTEYSAAFKATEDEWITYWEDGIDETTFALNCIVLPANYKTEGIQVTAGSQTVKVEPADIAAFIAGETDYSRGKEGEGEYSVTVDTDGEAFFLHFVLTNCE